MDSLLQLSNVACLDESLDEADNKEIPTKSSTVSANIDSQVSNVNSNSKGPVLSGKRVGIIAESDRSAVRDKIKTAFRKKADTYDKLLDLSTQLIEENITVNAPAKLDYYKAGIFCCKRIFDISNSSQLIEDSSNSSLVDGKNNNLNGDAPDEGGPKPVKRAKTQH